jgi:hypothetical protein
MTRPTRSDATDAIALVQATRRGDQRAITAVLSSANAPAMARALANVLPRAVRAQGVGVDDFLHSLTDGVIGEEQSDKRSISNVSLVSSGSLPESRVQQKPGCETPVARTRVSRPHQNSVLTVSDTGGDVEGPKAVGFVGVNTAVSEWVPLLSVEVLAKAVPPVTGTGAPRAVVPSLN